jgi:hypothetical protein
MHIRFFFQLFLKALVVAAFFAVVAMVTLAAYGYKYDREANKLEPTGIVFIDGAEGNLHVLLDGKEISTSLPTRVLGVHEGFHGLEVKKAGFLPWSMNIAVTSGLVTQVPFVLLLEEKPDQRFQFAASLKALFPSPVRLVAVFSDSAIVRGKDHAYYLLDSRFKKKTILNLPKGLKDPMFLTDKDSGYGFSGDHEFQHFSLRYGKISSGATESFPYDRTNVRFFRFSEDFSTFLFESNGELIGASRHDDRVQLYTRLARPMQSVSWFYDTHHFIVHFQDELQFCDETFANCYRLTGMDEGDTFAADVRGVYVLRSKEGRLDYLQLVTSERTFLSYISSEQVSL